MIGYKLVYRNIKDGWHLQGSSSIPVGNFIHEERLKQKRKLLEVEVGAGISHPGLFRVEGGKNESIKLALLALDELGFDVFVSRREG